jgi:hypothetical protein
MARTHTLAIGLESFTQDMASVIVASFFDDYQIVVKVNCLNVLIKITRNMGFTQEFFIVQTINQFFEKAHGCTF